MADKKAVKKSSAVGSKTQLKKPTIKNMAEKKPAISKMIEPEKPVDEQKVEINTLQEKPQGSIDQGELFLGASLLVIGGIWLASHFLHIPLAAYVWPFAIIIPGILLFISAVNMQSSSGEGFSIIGSILTSTGLLLFVQTITRAWSSWAYAWSLIAPTSIGLGQMLYGKIKGNETLRKNGWQVAKVGLIIFVIGFVFFELIIGLNGFGLARFGLPALPVVIIAIGVLILVKALTNQR